jgi:undecaprenyl-diphosphatase
MLQPLQSLDLWLFAALRPWQSPSLDFMMSAISISGTAGTIWLAAALVGLLRPTTRAAAWRLALTLLMSYVTVDLVLKPAIGRPRPVAIRAYDPPRPLPPMPRSLSFPSGHSAAAFGAAVAMSRMWPAGRVAWWTAAVLMGYSRIYVGHHFPLDVLGGAIVGVLVAVWVLGGWNRATYARPAPSRATLRP